jgi:hypothetical protein
MEIPLQKEHRMQGVESRLVFVCYAFNFAQDSVVNIVCDYCPGDRGLIPEMGKGVLFQPLRPDRFGVPPSLLSGGYRGFFLLGVKRGQGVTVNITPT